MKRFEYKIVSFQNENPITELNVYGQGGWEVIHIEREVIPHRGDPGRDVLIFIWLKRKAPA